MNYDFHQLNDKEFESLVNDLLSKELKVSIERYKAGKDQGIDGLFCYGNKKESIIQAKHYLGTGYSGLISTLKKKESPKVRKLQPSRYIFATSLPLSLKNKKEIIKIFYPYIKKSSDVYGKDDLNYLLSKYKDVERNHYKLWLSSINILQSILHNGISERSRNHLEQILKNSKVYVKTKKYAEAIKRLEKEKVIVISGIPGIGKTTLAENLCLYYTAQKYQFHSIHNVREGEDVFIADNKQIFYFDDFLGSNYLDIVEGNSDSHIVRFIERIKNHKNKLLVLTSRTNILQQGLRVSDHFKNSDLEHQELILTIKSLSSYDKALILYNHMWFSNLDTSLLNKLYLKKNYFRIINHKNFNPRLVKLITNENRLKGIDPEYYAEFIFETLDKPEVIWEHCFKRQSDSMDRALILLTVFNGGSITEDLLSESFSKLKIKKDSPSKLEKQLSDSLRDIIKIFLNRNIDTKITNYTVYNPSVSDYIISKYKDDTEKITQVLEALGTIESLDLLNKFILQKVINSDQSKKIINSLIKSSLNNDCDINYLIKLLNFDLKLIDTYENEIIIIIANLFKNPIKVLDLNQLLLLIKKINKKLKIDNWVAFGSFFEDRELSESELSELLLFLKENDIEDSDLDILLDEQIWSYVYDVMMDVESCGLNIEEYFEYEKWEVIKYEDEMIVSLRDIVSDILNNLNAKKYSYMIDNLISEIDTESIIDDYIAKQDYENVLYEEYKEQKYFSEESDEMKIDTLFNRT